jgi:hypothetical protein
MSAILLFLRTFVLFLREGGFKATMGGEDSKERIKLSNCSILPKRKGKGLRRHDGKGKEERKRELERERDRQTERQKERRGM